MKILYEDRDIIVIDKRSGLLSVKANYESEPRVSPILYLCSFYSHTLPLLDLSRVPGYRQTLCRDLQMVS